MKTLQHQFNNNDVLAKKALPPILTEHPYPHPAMETCLLMLMQFLIAMASQTSSKVISKSSQLIRLATTDTDKTSSAEQGFRLQPASPATNGNQDKNSFLPGFCLEHISHWLELCFGSGSKLFNLNFSQLFLFGRLLKFCHKT